MRSILLISSLILGVLGAGCTDNPTELGKPAIVVSPALDTVSGVGAIVQLTATVGSRAPTASISWTSLNGGVATVDSLGKVRAVAAGTALIVAAVGGEADTATLIVLTGVLVHLDLAPASVALPPAGTIQFVVSGTWTDGSSAVPAVTYSATGGTITADGLYTAGATPGTFAVIATQQYGTTADTSTVTIALSPPTLTQLVLTPASVTLAAAGTSQFAVSGTWSDGSTSAPAVTYSATGGTITAGGLYTAGTSAGAFQVIATQQGGTKSDTSTVTVTTQSLPSSCLRTVNASTVSGITAALSQAIPGDCILIAAGTYTFTAGTAGITAALSINRSGTATAPIIVQGVGSSTIIDLNQRLMYVDASYFQLRRLRLTNFPGVGLWLRGVTGVVLDSVEVDHTLQEAVALHYGSHHNIIKNSLIHDTGIKSPQYGEGIYIGGKNQDGVTLDFGSTDNQVLNNHIGPNVRADGVDVKEGADRTLIRGNFFDGAGAVYIAGASEALVSVVANDVTIDSNFMIYGKIHGVSFIAQGGGRVMSGNVATGNTIDLRDIHQAERGTAVPYGFQFQAGTTNPMGAVISCNNVMRSGILSNRPCTP